MRVDVGLKFYFFSFKRCYDMLCMAVICIVYKSDIPVLHSDFPHVHKVSTENNVACDPVSNW